MPSERPTQDGGSDPIDRIVQRLRGEPRWRERIVHWHEQPPREALEAPFPARMHPDLVRVLRGRGVEALRAHQAEVVTDEVEKAIGRPAQTVQEYLAAHLR